MPCKLNLRKRIPKVKKCCLCVTDLKTAAAIICVLGIVTSPIVSWSVVRHAYVIRVSCYITLSTKQTDVVDINLNNILSFGFGANAGLGPSCLASNNTVEKPTLRAKADPSTSKLVTIVKYVGWLVLAADFAFLIASINFLRKLFKGNDKSASKIFIITGLITILLSFAYGILYVAACISIGGSFPFFEFVFAFIDLIMWIMWSYFIIVIYSYYFQQCKRDSVMLHKYYFLPTHRIYDRIREIYNNIYDYFFSCLSLIYRYECKGQRQVHHPNILRTVQMAVRYNL